MGWVGSAGHLQLIIDHGRAGPLGTRLLFPTYLPTYVRSTHVPICLPTYLLTHPPTYPPTILRHVYPVAYKGV